MYVYYVVELAFYVTLFFSQFIDVKRKDFWQMFAHHVFTITLLIFSYTINNTRIGSLVLVVHDIVDIWLELAKIGVYIKCEPLSNVCFAGFALLWFVTRLVIFPVK